MRVDLSYIRYGLAEIKGQINLVSAVIGIKPLVSDLASCRREIVSSFMCKSPI